MDALTNVVAVLILVLILVQADVSQKVQKFIDDLPPATPEEIAASKQRISSLEQTVARLQMAMRQEAPTQQRIDEEKAKVAQLEKSLEANKAKLVETDKLRKINEQLMADKKAEIAKTATLVKSVTDLGETLDRAPPIDPSTPTVVNIPNSRPIPEDAKIYHAIVRRGRVHIIDTNAALKIFNTEFAKHRNEWLYKRVTKKGTADVFIYDGQKIEAFFKNYNWNNSQGQKIEIIAKPTSYKLTMIITPDLDNGGTALADLATPGSAYSKAAVLISGDFKAVLLFKVSTESFETYLAARELAERANIPAGWDISADPKYTFTIQEPTIRALDPPKPSGKPGPPKPKPPGPKLD